MSDSPWTEVNRHDLADWLNELETLRARVAELEAKQWDVIAQKFIDLDEHIMATAASVGCDSVASMAREIVKDRARIAELEADLDAISKAFRLHTRPPIAGT